MTNGEKRPADAAPSAEPAGSPQAGSGSALRRRAEEIAREKAARSPEDLGALSPEEIGRILHELRVHQIELEMQNDELRRAQQELEATRIKYSDLYDMAPVGYFTVDEKGMILEANLRGADLLGVERSRLVRQPLTRHIVPEDQDVYYLHRKSVLETGARQVCELRMFRKDGSPFWGRLETIAARGGEDGPPVFRIVLSDITERKRAEAEEGKLQAQLQQAMKMEAVGRLAGGVAHDFNNLLTVITGYSELLLQQIGKESPMHGEVEQIRRAGERAATLTRQLLAFSRKQIIEPKILDLNLLMADLGKMLVRLIGENIAMNIVSGKNVGKVKVDPGQFEQVLINLAVNARDAMSDGGTLLIETADVELDEVYCAQRPYRVDPGRYVRLAVSDTGTGMTQETSKKIFEPFFTTKEKGKGTGLGLSMIYGAVKQSGGSIEVYSEVGKGTTFKIYLPRVEGEAAKPVKDDRLAVLPTGTETVLVVEDEDILRDLCSRILGELGYKVLQARNGAEAITLAHGYGDRIDLLLTDVVMPGMDGAELARRLVVRHPKMKVLFTSGYTDDAISRHGVLDAGVSFIGKPYTPSALAKKVREILDKV
jgi:PAS domain S-box-containing protein